MKIEIEIISREMVTPSSPTPPHLKSYKLSFLDQSSHPLLMPHVLFYPANYENSTSNSVISNHLKKSLSRVLTLFYPLAGRLVGNSYVNCNDEGVTYVEAQADCNLGEVIINPNPKELSMFVPCNPDDDIDLCLVVQATFFSCGGLAIGLAISHKVADGVSYFMFVNSWAATSRRGSLDITHQSPIFESAALFPPKEDLGNKRLFYKKSNVENIVTKRFVFSSPKIEDLRDKYTKNTMIRPTRIETLSAFIWTRFMVVTREAKDEYSRKVHALRFTVDIRTRVVPPLSENHFGNFIKRTFAIPSLENDEDSRYDVVKKIRDAIRNVDQDHVTKIPEADEVVVFKFSSLCRLPLYESDFGWGKPVWVGSGKIPSSNIVFFMDSISGGGIDAWVNMSEDDMVRFEADEELNRYVSCGDDAKHMR